MYAGWTAQLFLAGLFASSFAHYVEGGSWGGHSRMLKALLGSVAGLLALQTAFSFTEIFYFGGECQLAPIRRKQLTPMLLGALSEPRQDRRRLSCRTLAHDHHSHGYRHHCSDCADLSHSPSWSTVHQEVGSMAVLRAPSGGDWGVVHWELHRHWHWSAVPQEGGRAGTTSHIQRELGVHFRARYRVDADRITCLDLNRSESRSG